jgi:hypothetical protein
VTLGVPMKRILRSTMMGTGFALCVLFMPTPTGALAFDFKDVTSIGAAYTTHLFFHEMGHQVVAEEVGGTYDTMKEINPDIKVLLSSGYSIDGQATEILRRGRDGLIQKPFNTKELSQRVREILDKE